MTSYREIIAEILEKGEGGISYKGCGPNGFNDDPGFLEFFNGPPPTSPLSPDARELLDTVYKHFQGKVQLQLLENALLSLAPMLNPEEDSYV